jgi:hypothetical protein
LIEFWRVLTRPADKNGFDMTTAQAETELVRLQDDIVDRLADHASVYDEWLRLVIAHEVKGMRHWYEMLSKLI